MKVHYIEDPISRNATEYYRKLEERVVYNMAAGNWERAERWARLLWAFAQAAQRVIYEPDREDA